MSHALHVVAFWVMWVLALLVTLGFGAIALVFAFRAGVHWSKGPGVPEREDAKAALALAILVGAAVLLWQRYT